MQWEAQYCIAILGATLGPYIACFDTQMFSVVFGGWLLGDTVFHALGEHLSTQSLVEISFLCINTLLAATSGATIGLLLPSILQGMSLGVLIANGVFLSGLVEDTTIRLELYLLLLFLGALASQWVPHIVKMTSHVLLGSWIAASSVYVFLSQSSAFFALIDQNLTAFAAGTCHINCIAGLLVFILTVSLSLLLRWVRRKQLVSPPVRQGAKTGSKKRAKQHTSREHADMCNYFDDQESMKIDSVAYTIAHRATCKIGKRFGFQHDNIQNQKEHFFLLLYNKKLQSTCSTMDALSALHESLFSNYISWCSRLHTEPILSRGDALPDEVALVLLSWGESSNLRHMPELQSFIAHGLLSDLRERKDDSFPPGTFLEVVLRPIFEEVTRKMQNRLHYDDVNEAFLNKSCLDFQYGMPGATSQSRQKHVSQLIATCSKTFQERRTHLRILHSFSRYYVNLMIVFHVLLLLALMDYFAIPMYSIEALVLVSSIAIVIYVLSVVVTILDTLLLFPNIAPYPRSCSVVIQVAILALLCVSYNDLLERKNQHYITVSSVVLLPWIYSAVKSVNPFSFQPRQSAKNKSNSTLSQFGFWLLSCCKCSSWKYDDLKPQVFWISLLSWKSFCSYAFQIRPLIDPSIEIWTRHDFDTLLFPGSRLIVLLSLWSPFLLIFFMDTSIWYAVWASFVGAYTGIVHERIGLVHSFTKVRECFSGLVMSFQHRFLSSMQLDNVAVDPFDTPASYHEPLLVNQSANNPWAAFSDVWNAMVHDMRQRDLLSNTEQHLLLFHKNECYESALTMPKLLTAGLIRQCFQDVAVACNATPGHVEWSEVLEQQKEIPFLRDAMQETCSYLYNTLLALLGPFHEEDVRFVHDELRACILSRTALDQVNLADCRYMIRPILELVRLLRVHSTMKSEASLGPSKMSGMKKSLSSASLNMLNKMQSTTAHSHHLSLCRNAIQSILRRIGSLCNQRTRPITMALERIICSENGFFGDDDYAFSQFYSIFKKSFILTSLQHMHALLALTHEEVIPASKEARRRILFFLNSLGMSWEDQQRLVGSSCYTAMSFSTLTPYYAEDVLYSKVELETETEDGVSPLSYLATIHPKPWENFLERVGVERAQRNRERILKQGGDLLLQTRQWASRMGQTLHRTVSGIMQYQDALRLLVRLQEPQLDPLDTEALVAAKFSYIVSCQQYGYHKQMMDPRATDIELLLHQFPHLRICYIDQRHQFSTSSESQRDTYFSVLIKSGQDRETIEEVYRIELPGNPIIGEGKPENQNIGMAFTRGFAVQTIDMNQDSSIEEAIKVPFMLQYLNGNTRILGVREHVFTGGLSSIAKFMALQEETFMSLGQRVLNNPLRMRMHYGHPDFFDKLWFMTRGGVSKASKTINLSEDIFAGYNCHLRGGEVNFKEFMTVGKGRDVGLQQLYKFEAKLAQGNAEQCLSRDVHRLAHATDIWGLFTLYASGPGFYVSNMLTIWALYLFVYTKVLWSLFETEYVDVSPSEYSLGFWFGQIGFLLTLPAYAALGVDHGFRHATWEIVHMLTSGGPLFFMFNMATKWQYFGQTLLHGGVGYRATGRGFVTKHEHFSELYRFHYTGHFDCALELGTLLVLYKIYMSSTRANYFVLTWPMWILVLSWYFAPFWFNPMAFEWEKLIQDFNEWSSWMRRKQGSARDSWKSWFDEENQHWSTMHWDKRILVIIGYSRFFLIAAGFLYHSGTFQRPEQLLWNAAAIFLLFCILGVFGSSFGNRYGRSALITQAASVLFLILVPILMVHDYAFDYESTFGTSDNILAAIAFLYGASSILIVMGYRPELLYQAIHLYHYMFGILMMVPLYVLSALHIPSMIQTRILFHNAFSKGVILDDLLRGAGRKVYDGDASTYRKHEQAKVTDHRKESTPLPKRDVKVDFTLPYGMSQ